MNITTAANEYARRPKDEQFPSFQALIDAAQADRAQCAEAVYNLRDLKAVPVQDAATTGREAAGLLLASPKGTATFTHYSFGQLARTIGAPASYLRTLPPAIAADAINYGLQEAAPVGTAANILIRDDTAQAYPSIRACTSEMYGRVWDGNLFGEVARYFGDGKPTNGGGGDRVWQSPPTWDGGAAANAPRGGSYRGDRDSFVLRIDGGSIVTDPSRANQADGGQMFRGLMIRNSEVGHCSISLEVVLFRFICGNHILWGATMDRQYRRRHVGTRITRDTMTELLTLARKFNHRAASDDQEIIAGLLRHEIAYTREAVIDELKKLGATKEAATAAYDTCERTETASPRSYWGLAQGFTRNSQESGYQDERNEMDRFAAQLLRRGALVAV